MKLARILISVLTIPISRLDEEAVRFGSSLAASWFDAIGRSGTRSEATHLRMNAVMAASS